MVAKPCSVQMVPEVHIRDDGDPFYGHKRYRRIVRKLKYLFVTQLDIAFLMAFVR